MKSPKVVAFQQWLLLLLFATISTRAFSRSRCRIPRLSPLEPIIREASTNTIPSANISNDLETFFYDQTLDHFNYNPRSYSTFKQRYVVNFKHWGSANTSAPILAYLGLESPIDWALQGVGFLSENAPRFKALIVYMEHRFYGQSNPLGSLQESLKNETIRSYFSSAQALADYAELLLYLKQKLSSPHSPIVVVGGSYGGMLASWFRLKYPHIAIGALASSAPILYFDNMTPQDGYYSIVSKDFKETSESCFSTIKKSWDEIKRIASKPNGLSILSQKFKTCTPLKSAFELSDYLDTLYCGSAQYSNPPIYYTSQVCGGIDGAGNDTDILDRVFAGLAARLPNRTCYNTTYVGSESSKGWDWQTCTEMVLPIGITDPNSMFPRSPYNITGFIDDCKSWFGITPRQHWITTYYGGHNIKLVLEKFGSNIIFSNGLRDPYSIGGILEDISETIVAIKTTNGTHILDLYTKTENDPQWLIMQRETEVKIIDGWIKKYYEDLNSIVN